MRPAPAQASLEQALAHHQAQRFEQATLGYARVRQQSPRQFEGWYLGGLVALQQGRPKLSLPLFEQAVRLAPKNALAHFCLATAHLNLGQTAEALRSFEQSLHLDPNNAEAWGNLGATRVQLGQLEEAELAYEKASALAPHDANTWSGLGAVKLLRGQPELALVNQQRALSLSPSHERASFAAGQALFQLCDVPGALAAFDEHLRRRPLDLQAASQRLLLLNYGHTHSQAEITRAHLDFGRLASKLASGPSLPAPPPRSRRRLVFISPDLRRHSVAYFLAPLLRHLSRETFEIYLYYDYFVRDDVSKRFEQGCDRWRSTVGLSDDAVIELLRADAPDVVIDLAGHTGSNRMPLFARRLAPLQVTYLGYPNTTGLPTMDLRLVDDCTDPIEYPEEHYTEVRERFAPCAWVYEPPSAAPSPEWKGTDPRIVTFGSFNNASKLSDAVLSCWAKILRGRPDTRLVIKSSGLRADRMQQRLDGLGFPRDRVTLLGPTATTEEHLTCYQRIDIALDAFPYHGTTTTCEALFMGVPVVCRVGTTHASRVGASLLKAVGHTEWLADSDDAYLDLALQLANEVEALRTRRFQLRQEMLASPLTDYAGHAEAWGNALLKHLKRRVSLAPSVP